MNLGLKEKVIIVSDGAEGIGEGISHGLASEGAYVVIVGANSEDNQKTIDKIHAVGGQAWSFVAELSDPYGCEKAVEEVVRMFGRIDGLVNNARRNDGINLENGTYEGFAKSLHDNLIYYYLLAHHALPYLKQSKGVIVNTGSKVVDRGQGITSATTNAGRDAFTREWAVELLKYGIRVNAVISVESQNAFHNKETNAFPNPTENSTKITDAIPIKDYLTNVEDMANMVVFLLSKRTSHTTGQIIYVDADYAYLNKSLV